MKVLFALLMCVFVNYSVQQNWHISQFAAGDECLKELHLDLEKTIEHVILDFLRADVEGDFTDNDQNFKCFLKCVLVKEGAMKESGELLVDVIKAYIVTKIGEEKATKIVEKCQKTTATDPCQVAFDLLKCIVLEQKNISSK